MSLPAWDVVALRHLSDSYASAVDRRDRAGLVELFTGAGVVRVRSGDDPGEHRYEGIDLGSILDNLDPYDRTFHHVGGGVFDTDPAAPGRARGEVHCLAHHYQRTASGPVDLVMMIRYLDSYSEGDDGIWLIADRLVIIEWTELHPANPRRKAK